MSPESENSDRSVIFVTATRYLLPLMLIFSIYILFRGHNAPGGGFIGGLVAAAAFALFRFAVGTRATRKLLRIEPYTLIGWGLLTAVISALIPLFGYNKPFLTAIWWEDIVLPSLGKLGSPAIFDTGVYLVVVGVVMLILFTLAEEEETD